MDSTSSLLDVLAIGHPLVDVIGNASDEWIEAEGLVRSSRRLIGAEAAVDLYERMGPASEASGGCAASTATGVVACGATAGFIGAVANDELGDIFCRDIDNAGVTDIVERVSAPPTGRCLIFVSPDGERTMNTCIGAGVHTSLDGAARDARTTARITYVEAYLFDNGHPVEVWTEAAERIHRSGGQLAITLSDSFCVDRHRDVLMDLLRDHIDVCLGNENEVKALFKTDDVFEGARHLSEMCDISAVTLGARGAVVIAGEELIRQPAEKVDVIDTTGAGDSYAAGFLAGLALGYPLERTGRLAMRTATEVVRGVGARLPVGATVEVP